MTLIQDLNESLRQKIKEGKDPFETENIRDIPGVNDALIEAEGKCGGHENEELFPTELSDDQIDQVVGWVYDTLKKEGRNVSDENAVLDMAQEALDNIAGFESADDATRKAATKRIMSAYRKKYNK